MLHWEVARGGDRQPSSGRAPRGPVLPSHLMSPHSEMMQQEEALQSNKQELKAKLAGLWRLPSLRLSLLICRMAVFLTHRTLMKTGREMHAASGWAHSRYLLNVPACFLSLWTIPCRPSPNHPLNKTIPSSRKPSLSIGSSSSNFFPVYHIH